MTSIRKRIADLGIQIPEAPSPVAAYVPAVRTGNLVVTAGQIPMADGVLMARGPVPSAVDIPTAQAAARQCALNAIAVIAAQIDGDLDRICRIVRLGVFVACDPGFTDQPQVANGASELMHQVFGEAGRHARSAVGSIALPLGASVEVEVIAEVS